MLSLILFGLPSLGLQAVDAGPSMSGASVATAGARPGSLVAWDPVRVPQNREVLLTMRDLEGAPRAWTTDEREVEQLLGRPGVLFAAPLSPSRASSHSDGWAAPTDRLVVRSKDGSRESALRAAVRALPFARVEPAATYDLEGCVCLRLDVEDGRLLPELANLLAEQPEVAWAEPDWILHGRGQATIPDDPLFSEQWALLNEGQTGGVPGMDIGVLSAWETTRGSSAAPVLVIDSGVDLEHPDLLLGPSIDLTDDGGVGGPVNVCDNHGTWVAGCISAIDGNGLGLTGAAPDSPVLSARALVATTPIGFCDGSWTTQASWTATALLWGRRMGARVSVNANAYGFESMQIEDAYAETAATGMVHFAAAGNQAAEQVAYPASLASVIAVGAIDATGEVAGFSNGGVELELVAPGVGIVTTDRAGTAGGNPLGDYTKVDGTSFAAPLAAAVASLMIASNPGMSGDFVRFGILATARDLGLAGQDTTSGFGLPDAGVATAYATGGADVQLPDVSTISLSLGGAQRIRFDAGNDAVGEVYLLLGSGSGTEPGFTFGGVEIPLVQDNWFQLGLSAPNSGPFQSTFGVLERGAIAEAEIVLPPGLNPNLSGLTLHHLFLRIDTDGAIAVAIEPSALRLTP